MTLHDLVKWWPSRLYRKRDGIGQTPCSYERYLVRYAFTSSPFSFHARHILPTSKLQQFGRKHFTDPVYADDVALLAEMLQTLVAGLLVGCYRMKPHL